jgi:hypothetical protein
VSRLTKAIGVVIWESINVVAILTMKSKNRKTGNMAKLWILAKDKAPTAAAADGSDTAVCGNCKHRPKSGGSCYVTLCQGPNGVYKAWRRGRYPKLSSRNYSDVLSGRAIRFGAYGDPAFIPFRILEKLSAACAGATGYTHQWETCAPKYLDILMASVDTLEEYHKAKAKGFRTFRVSTTGADLTPNEIACPAASNKTQCLKCKLCAARRRRAKDIVITVRIRRR